MMTNGDPEEPIFLSYPHMNNGLFFLLTFFCFFLKKKLPEVPEYAKMQLDMMTSLNITMTSLSLDDHVLVPIQPMYVALT